MVCWPLGVFGKYWGNRHPSGMHGASEHLVAQLNCVWFHLIKFETLLEYSSSSYNPGKVPCLLGLTTTHGLLKRELKERHPVKSLRPSQPPGYAPCGASAEGLTAQYRGMMHYTFE